MKALTFEKLAGSRVAENLGLGYLAEYLECKRGNDKHQ
jgi:hypothetical protein